ncbi:MULTISPECIES: dihydrodipicolinate synthase family protein [Mesorhizobium]|uniref:dihydrodipicolinate synthase family protein n=1 Tax=Mesorhizobium TaxID=68287 RepID=UPI0008020683|nr:MULTISPECIES: dihydrodipicolinate synthase family protein [Mesorhizobium]MUT31350.1 dihydrodipicolinate synthase family protein [Mesorhizobium japonicum]OBQ78162.1 dihydrodipicolinate synthase family protein [Mesorhizobium sp. WSM3873]
MTLFRGLSAFPLTPTDAEGHVDTEALARFLERIQHAGADSIGLLGSTGGYAYLTRGERKRAVQAAVECIGGKTPLVVGVGALRTDEAQALARDAKSAGADGLLLAPMSYVPLNEDEVFQHFVAVAEAGELPLCIYNNPSNTRFTFSDALIARLSEVSNIVAVKMPLAANEDYKGELARLRSMTPDTFTIGYSGDWGAADALLAGCDTWYSVAAGLLAVPALALTRAAQSGDAVESTRLNRAFEPLWTLFKHYGSFRVMFVIAEYLGLAHFPPPRPILPLPEDAGDDIRQALEKLEIALHRACPV